MLYYVLPYLFLNSITFLLYFMKLGKVEWKAMFFIGIFPALMIVLLRGNVGTDTLNYLDFFKNLRLGEDVHEFEPGFQLLGRTIDLFALNERVNLSFVSFITICLLFKSFSAKKENVIIFSSIIFPIFFYDMTMNGIRYGLSFAIASLAISSLYKKNNFLFGVLSILAISVQYSSFFIILVFFIFKLDKKILFGILALLILAFPFAGALISNNATYLYDKQDFYKDVASPGATSGLGPLVLFLMFFISFFKYSSYKRSNNVLFLILVLELASFALARVTYAGLRFQMLFLFALIHLIKEEFTLVLKTKEYLWILFLIGSFGFLITVKNLTAVVDYVESPFIPYRFFWQEN